MKAPRRRLLLLAPSYALLALGLLVGLAFLPPVQTALAKRWLRADTGLRVSLNSFSAGIRSVTVERLRLSKEQIALSLPSLKAQFPLLDSLRHREVRLAQVVAKGWTLDLSRRALPELPGSDTPQPDQPLPEARIAQFVLGVIGDALGEHPLPFAIGIDSLDLTGRVVLPGGPGMDLLWFDVRITGKDLAAGRGGEIEIEAARVEGTRGRTDAYLNARAQASLRRRTAKDYQITRFTVDASAVDPRTGDNRPLILHLSGNRTDTGAEVSLAVDRGARRVFGFQLRPGDTPSGSWLVDVQNADLAPLFRTAHLTPFHVRGSGTAALSPDLTTTTIAGSLELAADQLSIPGLEQLALGAVTAQLRFAARRDHTAFHLDSLDGSVEGADIGFSVRSAQPFTLTLRGDRPELAAADPGTDCLLIDLRKLPLARLVPLPSGFSCDASAVSGTVGVRASAQGFEVKATKPLEVAGLTVRHEEQTLVRDLSLVFPLEGKIGTRDWSIETTPFTIRCGSQALAELSLSARNDGPGKPATVKGRYSAPSGSTGDFTATLLHTATVMDANVTLPGASPGSTIHLAPHLELRADHTFGLTLPVAIHDGPKTTDLACTLESRARGHGKVFLYLSVSSKEAFAEHLTALGERIRPLLPLFGTAKPEAKGPIWNGVEASSRLSIDRLHLGDALVTRATAKLAVDSTGVTLEDGQLLLPSEHPAAFSGAITFEPHTSEPYALSGHVSAAIVNATRFFPAPSFDVEPPVEGIFAFNDSLSARAATITDLPKHLRGEVRLTAEAGMLRLLKTDLSDAYREPAKPVTDALAHAGTAVTWLAGIKSSPSASRDKTVGAKAAAVSDLNYELGALYFEKAAITATHDADGSIRLDSIDLQGPLVHLSGRGMLGPGDFASFLQRPLQCALRVDARGRVGELMTTAGLASATPTDDGRIHLAPTIELGGTLATIDTSHWHDLLVAKFRENRAQH